MKNIKKDTCPFCYKDMALSAKQRYWGMIGLHIFMLALIVAETVIIIAITDGIDTTLATVAVSCINAALYLWLERLFKP